MEARLCDPHLDVVQALIIPHDSLLGVLKADLRGILESIAFEPGEVGRA